ncbi:MAG: 50S ribosomal protein L15 [Ignavibacteriae bacterium]|nr:50S ribosomal protein L15 [Ignavibacteriota bacterium]
MAKNILSNLRPAKGSRKRVKRIGRGQGSGHSGTATRGHKGARSRSGFTFRYGFEGGQMPLIRRVPKHGFKPHARVEFQVVNVNTLEKLAAEKKISGAISPEVLYQAGAISNKREPVKILGEGELKSKLEVSAHAFSKSAVSKIEAAGGKTTVLS